MVTMTKIYIDAGHGGTDPGASGNGLVEKNLTLSISKKIEEILKSDYENVQIMMTRDTDVFLSLTERTNKANAWKADVFVAIHINAAASPSAHGFESHIYPNTDAKTISFQNTMHSAILKAISSYKVEDRGKERSNFHVLRESHMTAILTENLFVTSPSDATLLKKSDFIEKVAQGHVDGLEKFFGLKKKTKADDSSPPSGGTSDKLYQVVAGTFADRDNAEAVVKKLKADGYESYIQEK